MKAAIFGGTGFVGSYLVDALLGAGYELSLLVRPGSEHKVRQAERCRLVSGDIANRSAVLSTLEDCEVAIYLIGILRENRSRGITFQELQFEGARRVIDVAKDQRVQRFLLMSALGVRDDGTPYQRTKLAAERYLAGSGLAYTVFRPAVIFGDPRGQMEFATQLRDQLIRLPLPAPDFFSGLPPFKSTISMSPVHVEDVARAYCRSLSADVALNRNLELTGPDTLSWRDILGRIAAACGRRKLIVPVPVLPVRMAAALMDRFPFFPLSRDELAMLMQGSRSSLRDFEGLGIEPAAMTSDRLAYLNQNSA